MKTLIAIFMVGFCCLGSYQIGKVSADMWWKQEAVRREEIVKDELLRENTEINHSLYDWRRPIRTALYVGCTEKHTLQVNGITIEGTEFDYGIWLACPEGQVDIFGGRIELTAQEIGIKIGER